ncbi:hypothetical protein IFM89_029801 [Coptis chinensis]|uniref:Aminotransferase-like plant mobile domain-containing protein n=1 Tax=Coptis chinensis TaxID=261450 RepID=A0A835HQJ5_9MAGN|nr:hypothetical protein IFM89_029801 [Coptis chinensis]
MINCMIFVVMPPKTRGAKASQVQPSAAKLSRADKQPQTASFRKNHNRRKRGKNVIEEEIPSISVSEEENLEESNSIDSQEYSEKKFILSLKKKKEKAKGPDVRDEYPKEGPFPGGPTTTTVSRWYYEHVSFLVWLGKERGVLKTHQHTMKMLAWVVEGKCTTFWQKGISGGAYLYKQLSLASQHDVRQFCGFVALVEAWVYEHFPCFRPPYNSEYTIDMPRMKKWLVRTSTGDLMTRLVSVREELDELEARDVTWDPYRDVRASFSFDEVSFFSGCLCYLDDLAAYHPDQVLLQFGRVQGIPLEPLIPELDTSTPRNYKIIYPNIQGHQWSQWFNHVLNEIMRGTAVVDSSDCDPKYIKWYYSVSHPRVQNPVRCSGLFKHASVVARPTYDELISHISKAKSILKTLMDGGSAIAQITEAYQILSIDDSSAFSASKDPVDGSSASFASKDPVHDSSATSASTNPVGGPENEGCVAVVSNDGGPVNVKKRKTTSPGPGPVPLCRGFVLLAAPSCRGIPTKHPCAVDLFYLRHLAAVAFQQGLNHFQVKSEQR